MLLTPRSGRFVAWGNAVLAGLTSPDEAAQRVAGDEHHRLAGLPGEPEPVSLVVAFARLRTLGVTTLRLALPAPGDPLGLRGPAPFNEAAMSAGEAVLAEHREPWGVVPEVVAHGPPRGSAHRLDTLVSVAWVACPVNQGAGDAPSLADAEQELAVTLRRAADGLAALGVAQWRPEAANMLDSIRAHTGSPDLAPGYPPGAHRVLAQAERVAAIVEMAATDEGSAVTAGAMAARATELRALARAARRAQVAAHNAFVPGLP